MMDALIRTPLANAFHAYCWASKQGLEGAQDKITAEVSLDSLYVICAAKVSLRLTGAACDSVDLIGKRRGERRGVAG